MVARWQGVLRTAVDAGANSDKFPDTWLFHQKWGNGKKGPAPKLGGNRIEYIKVGGRVGACLAVPAYLSLTNSQARCLLGLSVCMMVDWTTCVAVQTTAFVPALQKLRQVKEEAAPKAKKKAPKKAAAAEAAPDEAAAEAEAPAAKKPRAAAPKRAPKRAAAAAAASASARQAAAGMLGRMASRLIHMRALRCCVYACHLHASYNFGMRLPMVLQASC